MLLFRRRIQNHLLECLVLLLQVCCWWGCISDPCSAAACTFVGPSSNPSCTSMWCPILCSVLLSNRCIYTSRPLRHRSLQLPTGPLFRSLRWLGLVPLRRGEPSSQTERTLSHWKSILRWALQNRLHRRTCSKAMGFDLHVLLFLVCSCSSFMRLPISLFCGGAPFFIPQCRGGLDSE
jgi:hypothetical protein